VVINEVDPNSGDAFIELYNPGGSDVDLEDWIINVDDDYTITAGEVISAGGYWVLEEGDFPSFFGLSTSGDNVYLYNDSGVRVDQVGWSSAPGSSWSRYPDGTGPNDGYDDATSQLVALNPSKGASNPASPSVSCGSWLNTYEGNVATRDVTATDLDSTIVSLSINVSPIPVTGTISLENFIPAVGVGGVATATVVVSDTVPAGVYEVTVTATNDDVEPQEGTCSFNVDVAPFLTIGEVQGVVDDDDDGTDHESPYEGEYVAVQGVIYQLLQNATSSGSTYYGFHLQNTAATADGDPWSSDGIYVFQSVFDDILDAYGGAPYLPQVGDEIIIRARVSEFFNQTELSSARIFEVVRTGVDLDAEIPAFEADPPDDFVDAATFDDLDDAYRYWERREGMRAWIPAGATNLNGRDVFASTYDAEIWLARGDSDIATRTDPYARRSYRDVHPLDDITVLSFDNGNPYRIVIGSYGVKATADDVTTMLTPSRVYDTLDASLTGGVFYTFGKYAVMVEEQPVFTEGVDPADLAPPSVLDTRLEYSVVTYNMENLYDYRDDPFDGCDFAGNSGCPGVSPPFDYVPPSDAVYQARLAEIAEQIVDDLHEPTIIMAQELEEQDICWVDETDGFMCGDSDDADGKPDVLQELADVIAGMGGPEYDAAYDRDGGDDRGIVNGYLFVADRVELLTATADHPVLGDDPAVDYDDPGATPLAYNFDVQNPKVLNSTLPDHVSGSTDGDNVFTRPALVGWFRIWRESIGMSVFQDVYLLNNHFSSGPDRRVEQRAEQAAYNAAIVEALQDADADVYVSVGGDLNVYPRPDDPFPSPDESDQLAALYEVPLTNLWNIQVSEVPTAAYSYIFQGQTQTLDQIFVAPVWETELVETRAAHINADWPADHPGDGPRGASDHDPIMATYELPPTFERLEELVHYFDSLGLLSAEHGGMQIARILLHRIDRSRHFLEIGKEQAASSQLKAFILQVRGLSKHHIDEDAARVLMQEADMLAHLMGWEHPGYGH
jgi:hypothetical protein